MPEDDVKPSAPTAEYEGLARAVSELGGQNAFLRQQVGQLNEAVRQLYDAVGVQCRQLLESDRALLQELNRFQTGGPRHAMSAVFHKLFRDLAAHVSALDDLVAGAQLAQAEPAWLDALRVLRDRFEKTLVDWGCKPVAIAVGADEFDPEIHEAAVAGPGEIPADAPPNVIVKVHRRGWKLHDHVLQHPLVVVS